MAQKYRKIDPRIWDDEKFDNFSTDEALLALWLLTGRCMNRCGIAVFTIGELCEKTRIPYDKAIDTLSIVSRSLGWTLSKASRTAYVIVLPKWFYYNPPSNWKHLSGMLSDLADVPFTDTLFDAFRQGKRFLDASLHETFENAIDTLSKGYAIPDRSQEQEQEQEQDTGAGVQERVSNSLSQVPEAKPQEPPQVSNHMNDPKFSVEWQQWLAKQQQERGRALDPITAQSQLYQLEDFTTAEATWIVRYSLSRSNCKNLIVNGDHQPWKASMLAAKQANAAKRSPTKDKPRQYAPRPPRTTTVGAVADAG